MKVRLGQKVKRTPSWHFKGGYNEANTPKLSGYVRYIHPNGRYYMVEFPVRDGVIRECYIGMDG